MDSSFAALRFLPDYELIGIHEQSPGSNHATHDRFVPTIGSAKELISHPDVDLVAIVGTSPLARDHVRDAIAAGKDVFCDWPILSDAGTAYELAALAERSGISDIIGLFPRVSQATLYVGDLLAELLRVDPPDSLLPLPGAHEAAVGFADRQQRVEGFLPLRRRLRNILAVARCGKDHQKRPHSDTLHAWIAAR